MKQVHKNKTSIIGIAITIIILISLVFLSNLKTGSLSSIENIFSSIIMPVQNGYTYLKNKISGNSSRKWNIKRIFEFNAKIYKL